MQTARWLAVLVCGAATLAYAQPGPATAPSAVPVGTVSAERRSIAKSLDFVGRVEAIDRVEIRARVKGYLEAVLFKEGDLIKEGAPLYRIEKDLFRAAVEQAQGVLESSKAQLELAVKNRQRQAELVVKNVGTAKALDEATATEGEAKGAVTTNEANLLTAQINLGYTDIVAPITGQVGRTKITKGNVVGPDSGPLTTMVSQDPMYVTFPVSQREILRAHESGKITREPLRARLRFADGSTFAEPGMVDFIDVSVDRGTDTITLRAKFPNPKGWLIDGQYVRVAVDEGESAEKVVVPQAALLADQQGPYVFVVEGGKAVVKRVKLGGDSGTDSIVESGLSGGEQIVVEGLQSLRPGVAVVASPTAQLSPGH
jgi:membrane fusion protein (multidrug efflux system)